MSKTRSILIVDVFHSDAMARLQTATAQRDVASVVLTGVQTDPRAYMNAATPLVQAAQALGIAALVIGEVSTVQYTGADGLHLNVHGMANDEIKTITNSLRPKFIVGGGDLRSKDDAFTAAEHELDYIFFGNITAPDARGNDTATLAELATWWVEIAEIPCVCLAPTAQAEAAIMASKAEFVAYFA